MFDMKQFEDKVSGWAWDRGIIQNGNPVTQFAKLVSEIGELADNIAKGKDVRDDIGDCLVVLAIIAELKGTNLSECADVAWGDIKGRKGFLNENGVFIKETV